MTPAVASSTLAFWPDCRLCGSRLFHNRERNGRKDDANVGLCAECYDRPEAKRFLGPRSATVPPKAPRLFNAAEKALIGKVHGYMPAAQLLDILNTRLVADVGAAAVPFTAVQLQAEVAKHLEATASEGDWASLRKVLARARQTGVLETITPQVVDDFAVIWGLSTAQHMRVRDVIRHAQEER